MLLVVVDVFYLLMQLLAACFSGKCSACCGGCVLPIEVAVCYCLRQLCLLRIDVACATC